MEKKMIVMVTESMEETNQFFETTTNSTVLDLLRKIEEPNCIEEPDYEPLEGDITDWDSNWGDDRYTLILPEEGVVQDIQLGDMIEEGLTLETTLGQVFKSMKDENTNCLCFERYSPFVKF